MLIWVTLSNTVEDKYGHEDMSVTWKHVICNYMFMDAHADGGGREECLHLQSGCRVWRVSCAGEDGQGLRPCWTFSLCLTLRKPQAAFRASRSGQQALEYSCFVRRFVIMVMRCLRNPTLVHIRLWQNWFRYLKVVSLKVTETIDNKWGLTADHTFPEKLKLKQKLSFFNLIFSPGLVIDQPPMETMLVVNALPRDPQCYINFLGVSHW